MNSANDILLLDARMVQSHHVRTEADVSISNESAWSNNEFDCTALYEAVNGVAVISLVGSLYKSGNPRFEAYIGSIRSYGTLRMALMDILADKSIRSVLLIVDSPGGMASGCASLSDTIRGFGKPLHVYVDGLMASAALELASGADYISSERAAWIGSIGSIITHFDYSKMLAEAGITVTQIATGPKKGVGSPHKPLSDEDKAFLQKLVDTEKQHFVENVALGRGMSTDEVDKLATGEIWPATEALSLGLVDGLGTLEQALERAAAVDGN